MQTVMDQEITRRALLKLSIAFGAAAVINVAEPVIKAIAQTPIACPPIDGNYYTAKMTEGKQISVSLTLRPTDVIVTDINGKIVLIDKKNNPSIASAIDKLSNQAEACRIQAKPEPVKLTQTPDTTQESQDSLPLFLGAGGALLVAAVGTILWAKKFYDNSGINATDRPATLDSIPEGWSPPPPNPRTKQLTDLRIIKRAWPDDLTVDRQINKLEAGMANGTIEPNANVIRLFNKMIDDHLDASAAIAQERKERITKNKEIEERLGDVEYTGKSLARKVEAQEGELSVASGRAAAAMEIFRWLFQQNKHNRDERSAENEPNQLEENNPIEGKYHVVDN